MQLEVNEFGVSLHYQGPRFGLRDLLATSGRGGKQTVENFIQEDLGVRALNFAHDEGKNSWIVSDLKHPDMEAVPCCISPTVDGDLGWEEHVWTLELCDEVHVFLPELFSLSDGYELIAALEEELSNSLLVFHNAATFALSDILRGSFPTARFVPSETA